MGNGMLSLIFSDAWSLAPIAQAPTGGGAADTMPLLMMFLVIGALFYFIILRPQRNEAKKREEMLNQVAKGDHVVTIGGIHGTVEGVDVNKNVVSLSIAPKTTVRVNRSALGAVTPRGKKGAQDSGENTEKAEK